MKKYLKLLIFASLMLLLAVVPTSAQQGVGNSPYVAHILASGLNVGDLSPGESFWYSFSAGDLGQNSVQSVILDLVFKPGDRRTATQVTFDIYTFDQLKALLENGQAKTKEGTGQLTTSGYDANTGERLWAGAVARNEIYYIRMENKSGLTVDYHLNVLPQQVFIPATLPAAEQAATFASVSPETILSPTTPLSLDNNAGASEWLLAARAIQSLSPEEGAAWLKNAVELGWLSTLAEPEPVGRETTTAGLEVAPAVEEATSPTTAVPVEPKVDNSIYPTEPLVLNGRNVGRLAPHAEHWYAFLQDDLDAARFEEMALTLFHTPGEGNIANLVNFELFTGDQFPIWLRGTPEAMQNFGAGSRVSRDRDPDTGERLWRGTVVDGDKYFIRVQNDSEVWIDYYLMTDDVINTELGDAPNIRQREPQSLLPARRVIDIEIPPGTDIANPLQVQLGHNQGWLDDGQDKWYLFRFQNFERTDPEFRRYGITLKHSPGLGYVANHVNVEIYSYEQRALWLRGDRHLMTPLGVGSRQNYDKKTNTQEFVWDGHFVSDAFYFIRVRNDSEESIIYDLNMYRK